MSLENENKRVHERTWFRIACTLTLESGPVYHCQSTDISLRGVGLSGSFDDKCRVGARGSVSLDVPGIENKNFACSVAHRSTRGIGLAISQAKDNFGHVVTQAIFGEMSTKIGVESDEWSKFDVYVRKIGRQYVKARVKKLNTRNADIYLPTAACGKDGFNHDDKIEITVKYKASADACVVGVLVDYPSLPGRGGERLEEKFVRVLFGSASDKGMENLARLIRGMQEKRLSTIVQNRVAANSLLSRDTGVVPTRSDVKRDINRFFSYKKK